MSTAPDDSLMEIVKEVYDLEVPNDSESLRLHAIYVATINAVQASNDHNATTSCIVCGGTHRFDSCDVLKNTDFLRGHYIRYCQQLRRDTASRAASFPGTTGDVPLPRAPVHTLEATSADLPLEQHSSDDESVTDMPLQPLKPSTCRAILGEGSNTFLPSAKFSPRSADITVLVSNVFSPLAPDVATVADDDPLSNSSDFINSPILLNQGWVLHNDDVDDDDRNSPIECDDDHFNDHVVTSMAVELNAIDIHFLKTTASNDIFSANADNNYSDSSSVTSSTSSNASSVIQEDIPLTVDDDPNALCEIDTGAFASVTDQLNMLHDYREFSDSFPCLQPAKEGLDILPLGVGFLHVPCMNEQGHIPVRTFYSLYCVLPSLMKETFCDLTQQNQVISLGSEFRSTMMQALSIFTLLLA